MVTEYGEGDGGEEKAKEQLVKILEDKLDNKHKRLIELYYAKGYAVAYKDLYTMIAHFKGKKKIEDVSEEDTITMQELGQFMEIGMKTLPSYQRFEEEQRKKEL